MELTKFFVIAKYKNEASFHQRQSKCTKVSPNVTSQVHDVDLVDVVYEYRWSLRDLR